MTDTNQKIVPCLWFDKECEEAINFYVEVFNGAPHSSNNSKVVSLMYYPDNVDDEHVKGMDGKIITGIFELNGQKYMALDGGPIFKFNEAISLCVDVQDQEELDYFWEKLSAVPESEQCGWLKDKYGLSWQIVPKQLGEFLEDPDKEKSGRAMTAMLQMKKLDIAELEKAFEGK